MSHGDPSDERTGASATTRAAAGSPRAHPRRARRVNTHDFQTFSTLMERCRAFSRDYIDDNWPIRSSELRRNGQRRRGGRAWKTATSVLRGAPRPCSPLSAPSTKHLSELLSATQPGARSRAPILTAALIAAGTRACPAPLSCVDKVVGRIAERLSCPAVRSRWGARPKGEVGLNEK
jgi:hypothetical protein